MRVNTQHKDYSRWYARWERCRDAAAGEDAVKEKGETYLPRPAGQNDKEYASYKTRAYWFNATQRTVDGLTGLIFRKEPVVEAPESMDGWLEDITMTGVSFREVASQVVDEVVKVGRSGILVDFPQVGITPELTVAQVEALGARPYLALYEAEDIINWRYSKVGPRTELALVVLRETTSVVVPQDEFKSAEAIRYRVLDLEPETGHYRQRLFEKVVTGEGAEDWIETASYLPQMNGAPLPYIPFFFAGVSRSDGKIELPPILDLVNVNLSHYRTLADLEHGAHWSGLPTPVLIGLSEDKKEIALGSTAALVLPPGGDAKFLEFGAGLDALEKRASAKADEMALLGARILSPEKRAAETAEAAAIHRAGENSVLASIAVTASRVLTAVMKLLRDWGGLTGDVSITLNTEYLATQMSPAMLTALTAAVQQGQLSFPDYFRLLQRGDIIAESRTSEEAQADIEAAPPLVPVGAAPYVAGAQE